MRACLLITSVVLLCCSGLVLADSAEQARLARGEVIIRRVVVPGSEMPEAIVRGVIDAPPARVWAIIDRCAHYPGKLPRVKAARELSRKGNIVVCDVTIDMPFPFSDLRAKTRAVHTVRKGFFRRAWNLIEGDFKHNRGSWTFTPFSANGRRTLAVYRVHALPNTPLPIWLQRKASETTLPNLFKALRKAARVRPKGR